MPAVCARRVNSATETTPSLRNTRLRWILIVRGAAPSSAAICLLSNPAITNRKTSNSLGVAFSADDDAPCLEWHWVHRIQGVQDQIQEDLLELHPRLAAGVAHGKRPRGPDEYAAVRHAEQHGRSLAQAAAEPGGAEERDGHVIRLWTTRPASLIESNPWPIFADPGGQPEKGQNSDDNTQTKPHHRSARLRCGAPHRGANTSR